jgi:hypothetical protein
MPCGCRVNTTVTETILSIPLMVARVTYNIVVYYMMLISYHITSRNEAQAPWQ